MLPAEKGACDPFALRQNSALWHGRELTSKAQGQHGPELLPERMRRAQGLFVYTAPQESGGPFSLPPAPVSKNKKKDADSNTDCVTRRVCGMRLAPGLGGLTGIGP